MATGGFRLCVGSGNFGGVEVHDLPAGVGFMQYEGSPVEESRPVGEVKGCDCHIAKKLNSQISGLNVHVRPNASSLSYLLKNYFEGLLKFGATVCALGKCARIEDGRGIVKCQTKALPIQVIEGLHELFQCVLHLRFR